MSMKSDCGDGEKENDVPNAHSGDEPIASYLNERGEDYQEQIGMPDEENMRSWSHHLSTDTVDDPIFRAAMRGYDTVSFVFGLEVTWSLIQHRQQEEEERQAMLELETMNEINEISNEDEADQDDPNPNQDDDDRPDACLGNTISESAEDQIADDSTDVMGNKPSTNTNKTEQAASMTEELEVGDVTNDDGTESQEEGRRAKDIEVLENISEITAPTSDPRKKSSTWECEVRF